MQIKLGETIRSLRQRDGRTQEALAAAIGVTGQAVSRWESGGGYPDIETIPAIANYFHITIDELFGYNSEREVKIKKILDESDSLVNAQGDMNPCIELLRNAISEFPSEVRLKIRLGYVLTLKGWKVYGIKSKIDSDRKYAEYDSEYNSENSFWREALEIFEKVLREDISTDDYKAIVLVMTNLYNTMGENSKSVALVMKQQSLIISRECLLPLATEGEARDRYQGEALLELAKQLKMVMVMSVMTKISIAKSEFAIEKLLSVARIFEAVLDDGNCGIEHNDLRELYLWCSIIAARIDKIDLAMEYFAVCFGHKLKYEAVLKARKCTYTAPLAEKVQVGSGKFVPVMTSWKELLGLMPENLIAAVKADARYGVCFE